jgi:hypothetical protein
LLAVPSGPPRLLRAPKVHSKRLLAPKIQKFPSPAASRNPNLPSLQVQGFPSQITYIVDRYRGKAYIVFSERFYLKILPQLSEIIVITTRVSSEMTFDKV